MSQFTKWAAEMDRAASAVEAESDGSVQVLAIIDGNRAIAEVLRSADAALRDIGKILDRGMIRHSVLCLAQRVGEPCVCGRLEIRAIVERAVGGES